jgi:hypothetical protein
MDSIQPNRQTPSTKDTKSGTAAPSTQAVAKFNEALNAPQIGSSFPIINDRPEIDAVLIQNPNTQESYWVSKGAAADAASAAALGTSISPPDILGDKIEATDKFINNYQDMRDANTIGADKYFHCKANCEAAQVSDISSGVAKIISDAREWADQNIKGDPEVASQQDQEANYYGREQGSNNLDTPCTDICQPFRPNGLDSKY